MLLHTDFDALESKVELIKNLGHPLRFSVAQLLAERGELSVTEIFTALEVEQAVASHHLKIMKNSGIVQANKDGKNVLYSLTDDQIKIILDAVMAIA